MQIVDMWKKLQHTNVVQLREVFTTKTFGDNCKYSKYRKPSTTIITVHFFSTALVIVYDYHPGSQTLLSKYFIPSAEPTNGYSDPFSGEARPFRWIPLVAEVAKCLTKLLYPQSQGIPSSGGCQHTPAGERNLVNYHPAVRRTAGNAPSWFGLPVHHS